MVVKVPYVVILTDEDDGQVSASIPDLPNVFAAGDSVTDAMHRLVEAVRLYVDYMKAEGIEIPRARTTAERIEIPS